MFQSSIRALELKMSRLDKSKGVCLCLWGWVFVWVGRCLCVCFCVCGWSWMLACWHSLLPGFIRSTSPRIPQRRSNSHNPRLRRRRIFLVLPTNHHSDSTLTLSMVTHSDLNTHMQHKHAHTHTHTDQAVLKQCVSWCSIFGTQTFYLQWVHELFT